MEGFDALEQGLNRNSHNQCEIFSMRFIIQRHTEVCMIDKGLSHLAKCLFVSFLLTCLGSCEADDGIFMFSEKVRNFVNPTSLQVEVTINNAQEHQTMEGFGATHIPLSYQKTGDNLSSDLRDQAIDSVYNQVGITMGNLEGALLESPGTYEERANDNGNPFKINWNGFQTFWADEMKEKIVDLAKPFGFDNYFLGQKINVRWTSPWLKNIRTTNYNRYLNEAAEQVVAGQIYWRDTYDIVPRYQMLFNEPLSGNKELQDGNVKDVVNIVKRSGDSLYKNGFRKITFVIPNEMTVEKSLSTITAILSDSKARRYVGAIGYHTYSSVYESISKILNTSGKGNPDSDEIAVRKKLRNISKKYGIPVWMTEIYKGGVGSLSFDDFRGRAIHIHDELIYANASAFFGMNNMWDTTSHEEHFGNSDIFNEEGNIILIDNDTETIYITGMGYAIGHYARWIKKGAIRIEATSSDTLVQITAFRNDSQRQMVLVIINNASSEKTINANIVSLSLSASENLIGEQSTSEAYWKQLTPFAPKNSSSFTLTLPAESVTTVMGQVIFN